MFGHLKAAERHKQQQLAMTSRVKSVAPFRHFHADESARVPAKQLRLSFTEVRAVM